MMHFPASVLEKYSPLPFILRGEADQVHYQSHRLPKEYTPQTDDLLSRVTPWGTLIYVRTPLIAAITPELLYSLHDVHHMLTSLYINQAAARAAPTAWCQTFPSTIRWHGMWDPHWPVPWPTCKRLLMNIITNVSALPNVSLDISFDATQDFVITCRDDGPGLPFFHQKRLETPLDTDHYTPSQALGLQGIAALTRATGGTCHSQKPKTGHLFTLSWPASHTPAASILLIDDDIDFLTQLSDILSQWGYRSYPCHTLQDAHMILDTHPISLCLCDEHVPDGSGSHFLRTFVTRPGVKGGLMTGMADTPAIESMPFFALEKPFSLNHLEFFLEYYSFK